MRNSTIKNNEKGFTILELAIVFALVGIVIAPAIALYKQHRKDKDWDMTEERITELAHSIGTFRSTYGRYPCPASRTAVPGDVTYGHEFLDGADNCTLNAPGTCTDGICTANNPNGDAIVIGSIPFKALNLQESETFDRYLGRISYAVTYTQTSNTTFELSQGAIGVVDKNGNTMIDPENTGHFIIISHGQNKAGAYNRSGVENAACVTGSALEQENCDDDYQFVSGGVHDNTDDRVSYFTSVYPSEWQLSEASANHDIHLKNTDSVALGASVADDLTNAERMDIYETLPDNGVILSETSVISDELCEYDGTDPGDHCFKPRRIAGLLDHLTDPTVAAETVDQSGMSCYDPTDPSSKDTYMIGIAENEPVCSDEIFIACSANNFIVGIDSNGGVICDGIPADPCEDQDIVSFCGNNHTLSATYSGDYEEVFSGECKMITNYNSAYFSALADSMTQEELEAEIDTINAEPRTTIGCNNNRSDSLVRDNYKCTAANWNKVATHEKGYNWWSFDGNLTATSGWTKSAESNDCLCTESYRAIDMSCGTGYTGTATRIQKNVCPNTATSWSTILTTRNYCVCTPTPTPASMSCNAYYDELNGTTGTTGLVGTVYFDYEGSCVGDTHVVTTNRINLDASGCGCMPDTDISRTYCSSSPPTTNNWTSPFGTEIGVEHITVNSTICPGGTGAGGLPNPAVVQPQQDYSEVCTCNGAKTGSVTIPCGTAKPGTTGDGITYERTWDCVAGDWEPESDWTEVADKCYPCAWEANTTPSLEDTALGGNDARIGNTCECGTSPTPFCWDYADGGKFDVWQNCQCTAQIP